MNRQIATNHLATQFNGTTIDVKDLTTYLYQFPTYLESGIALGASEKALEYLSYNDSIDFWLRRYLAGRSKTLHRLFYEIRAFMAHNNWVARNMVNFVFCAVKETILANEYFELMERFERAYSRTCKAFALEPINESDLLHGELTPFAERYYRNQPKNEPDSPE